MLSLFQRIGLVLGVATVTFGQGAASGEFDAGYRALAKQDYDAAIGHFRVGLSKQPGASGVRKDLGYTLLKTGENTAAREEFAAALALNTNDEQAALEYAFLAYETGKPVEARRKFDSLRKNGSPATRKIAEQAFQSIDGPLEEGIARWRQVLDRAESPAAHCELARLAELRDDAQLAAEQRSSCRTPAQVVFEDKGAVRRSDLRLQTQARSMNVWTFFDSAYRVRADVEYLAQRWREAGISALFVATWHNMEADSAADEYLARLIDACHRHSILVYAWIELPYVSERFWADHPEWREKTGLGQDAQIGWRKLMNLQNPECSRAAAGLVKNLLDRFAWDGINLTELSFEGSESAANAAFFTPMNGNVRSEFKEIADFDPMLLFNPASAHASKKDVETFLGFRRVLTSRMQSEWLKNLGNSIKSKPYLDLLLTYKDDCSNLIVGNRAHKKIALDLNVREQQGELLQSIRRAAESSLEVALYAENIIGKADLPLISAAASSARVIHQEPGKTELEAAEQTRMEWPGPAAMDGETWPIRNGHSVIVPAGHHILTEAATEAPFHITDFNGDIQSATVSKVEVDIAYRSRSRALVSFDDRVGAIGIDGAPFWKASPAGAQSWAILPAGQHLATFTRQ